jgi:hypothetical protein
MKKEGAILLGELMLMFRKAFYADSFTPETEKVFYHDRNMLRQAATYPAHFLKEKGWRFDPVAYKEIIAVVIATIRAYGRKPEEMQRRSAYILHCVQDHMQHNWDRYWQQSKRIDLLAQKEARRLESLGVKSAAAETDAALRELAGVHAALTAGKPGRKARPRREIQGELF